MIVWSTADQWLVDQAGAWQMVNPNQENDADKTQTHIDLTKGTMVGHYRIIEKIGAGGMAEAYFAEDDELNCNVARIP